MEKPWYTYYQIINIDMTLTKSKPQRPTLDHKRRTGRHHHHSPHYLKTYWPYIPIIMILATGIVLNSWLANAHRSVLGYATDMSIISLWADTNQQRLANGFGNLQLNTQLNIAAQSKANDMAARDYWSHNTPDGKTPWSFISNAGYNYQTAGENLAYGFDTASDTLAGWMNSPEHKANILNSSYKDVGFGIINIPDYQNGGPETLVVAMYASPAAAVAASPVEKAGPIMPVNKQQPSAQAIPTPAPQPIASVPATVKPASPVSSPRQAVASAPVHQALAPEPKAKQITRYQLVSNTDALNYAALGTIAVCSLSLILLRHSMAWHRRLIRGERFVLRHPLLDILAAGIICLSLLLGNIAGIVR